MTLDNLRMLSFFNRKEIYNYYERLSVSTDKIFEDKSDQSIYGIVKTLVTEFEKIACVYFDNRDELERALFIHIRSSLYRLRYGIQLGNPMREDIVREYANLFNITKTVSQYLERMRQPIGFVDDDLQKAGVLCGKSQRENYSDVVRRGQRAAFGHNE